MARYFDESLQQRLYNGSFPGTTYPFTIAAWALRPSGWRSMPHHIAGLSAPNWNNIAHLAIEASSAGHMLHYRLHDGSTELILRTTTETVVDTYFHACIRSAAANDHAIFLDGGGKATSTTSVSPDSLTGACIGASRIGASWYRFYTGRIAEVAYWSIDLTDAEIAALAAGAHPYTIRPAHLVAYYPLLRTDQDLVGGHDVTPENSPTWADHAPTILWPRPAVFPWSAPAAAGAALVRAVDDAVGITEATARVRGLVHAIDETLGITDALHRVLTQPPAPQVARPDSDITTNGWTTTPLYQQIDEETYSDTDYIERNAVSYCEVGLSSLDDPDSSSDHSVRYRLGRSRTDRTLTIVVRLYQGSTEIASWEHVDPAASFVGFEQTLTSTQADAITDYSDLRLRFDVTSLQNSQVYGQVSWAEMEVPAASSLTALVKLVAASLGISETTRRPRVLNRPTADTLAVSETTRRPRVLNRVLATTVAVAEALVRPRTLIRLATDTLAVTEAVAYVRGLVRSAADAVGISEATTHLRGLVRSAAESIGLSEALLRPRVLNRPTADTLAVNESTARPRVLTRALAATVGLTESISRLSNLVRIAGETVGITETVDSILSDLGIALVKVITSTVAVTEALARPRSLIRTVATTVDVGEALTRARSLVRSAAAAVGISDAAAHLRTLLRPVSDTLTVSEHTARPRSLIRTVATTIGLTESISRLANLVRIAADTVGIGESASRLANLVRIAADALGISEALRPVRGLLQAVADALGITEAAGQATTLYTGPPTDPHATIDVELTTVETTTTPTAVDVDNQAARVATTTDPTTVDVANQVKSVHKPS